MRSVIVRKDSYLGPTLSAKSITFAINDRGILHSSIDWSLPTDMPEFDVLRTAAELEESLGIGAPAIANPIYLQHRLWMMRAIALANTAAAQGEVPVAAMIINSKNQLVAHSINRKEQDRDPTGHAEVLALRAAGKQLDNWHLNDCTLYVTLEPCPMCAGAIIQSRLGLLVYGANDPKAGAIRSALNLPDGPCSNHQLAVISGILEAPCREQLQRWFRNRRSPKKPLN